jgi:tetratricopeptide (TPR) repeat protein
LNKGFAEQTKGLLSRSVKWFRRTQLRLYWSLAFVWNLIIWLTLALLAGRAAAKDISAIPYAVLGSAALAFYMSWLVLGSLGHWDKRWRQAIEVGRAPQWTSWLRLFYVVLPYYFFGWVPEKLLQNYFYRYLLKEEASALTREETRTLKERVASELKAAAQEVLISIWKEDLPLSLRSKVIFNVTQSLVNVGLAKEANIAAEEALKVIARIKEEREELRLETLLYAFQTLTIIRGVEEALITAQNIQSRTGVFWEDEQKGQILRSISLSLIKHAKDFERAIQVAQQIKHDKVRGYALGDICEALAEAGQVKRALELAQQISDSDALSHRAYIMEEISGIACEVGRIQEGLEIARMIGMEFPAFRLGALLHIAGVLAKAGRTDEAKALVSEALEIPYNDRSIVLLNAARVLAQMNEIEEALTMAKMIERRRRYTDALKGIAWTVASKGDFKKALDIAYQIDSEPELSQALSSISEVLAEAGHTDRARDIAEKISDDDERIKALSVIAEAFAKLGNIDQTLNIVKSFIGTEYQYRRLTPINTLVTTLAKQGRIDEALKIIYTHFDPYLGVIALAEMYSALSKKNGTLESHNQKE